MKEGQYSHTDPPISEKQPRTEVGISLLLSKRFI